jgi:glycosyltransferase involved in cell wall biosynthesis
MEKAFKNSCAIIVPSRSIKKDVIDLFNFNEEKIFVIEHGNSLPRGKSKKIDKPYFLSFGTIEPRKNLDFYAKAITLSGLMKDFDFIHVGRTAWGVLPKVFKHISANDQELADLITNSHCVVVPSLYEGFGLPVLEAHYQGKNVLLSNDEALCELKLDSDSIFELNNLDSLISQLKRVSTEVNQLSTYDIEKTNQYNWNKSVQKHLDLYRKFYE